MRFAIALLLGVVMTTESASAIDIMTKPAKKMNVQMETDSDSDSESDEENVQTAFDGFYPAHLSRSDDSGLGGYSRVTTARFSAGRIPR